MGATKTKKILILSVIVALFLGVGSVSTYYLYELPKQNSEKLQFEKQKWSQEQVKIVEPEKKVNLTQINIPKEVKKPVVQEKQVETKILKPQNLTDATIICKQKADVDLRTYKIEAQTSWEKSLAPKVAIMDANINDAQNAFISGESIYVDPELPYKAATESYNAQSKILKERALALIAIKNSFLQQADQQFKKWMDDHYQQTYQNCLASFIQ